MTRPARRDQEQMGVCGPGPVEVYGRWDPGALVPAGYDSWTHDACYLIVGDGETLATIPVDQTQQCGGVGDPWQPLGTYDTVGGLTVYLQNYNPNTPGDNGDGRPLYLDAVMFQTAVPPTLSITAPGQTPQPAVAPRDPAQYDAWQDPWQTVQIPVEDGVDRTELHLHAAYDQVLTAMTNWQASLLNTPNARAGVLDDRHLAPRHLVDDLGPDRRPDSLRRLRLRLLGVRRERFDPQFD